jgi:hypothetical protein
MTNSKGKHVLLVGIEWASKFGIISQIVENNTMDIVI